VAGGRTLIVGTRGSRLALRQTDLAIEALRVQQPDLQFEVREIRTEGDRSKASLMQIGGLGVFVKELEAALLRNEIDVAVHSLKDVPNDLSDGLTLAAVLPRADPRDALVTRDGATLADLPAGARAGTGSARRAVQLRLLRPDIEPVDIRGNVDTRVRKVDEGEFDAAVLAVAGLERLGLLARASQVFDADAMLPAVGQGALALEVCTDDAELIGLLAAVDHRDSRLACEAERAFLARLGGGCRLPFGALATVEGETLHARGFISDAEGSRVFRADASGSVSAASTVGTKLAEALLAQGAEVGAVGTEL
jgi:hydroxymethylbilane synthase